MTRRVLLGLILLVLVAPAATAHGTPEAQPPRAQSGDGLAFPFHAGAAEYRLTLRCGGNADVEDQRVGCPVRIFDSEDIMGQPRLVLHPLDWRQAAFNALHGGRGLTTELDAEPPTPRSRDNAVHQPHTTFRTGDPFGVTQTGTLEWQDQPYYSPLASPAPQDDASPLCPPVCANQPTDGPVVWGEDNDLAIARDGRMYEASLYAHKPSDAVADHAYAIVVWKQAGPHKERDQDANYHILHAETGQRMDSLHLSVDDANGRVVTLWRASDPGADPRNWIDVAWTPTGNQGTWTRLAADQRIGPCRSISNPVTYDGTTYVTCVADDGYEARTGAAPGDMDVYAIDTDTRTTRYVDTAPLDGDAPVLALRSDGAMLLAAAKLTGPRTVQLQLTHGALGANWTHAEDHGGYFPSDVDLGAARVQALAYSATTGNAFLILQTRTAAEADAAAVDPRPEFAKHLASIHVGSDLLDTIDLDVGDPAQRKNFPLNVQGLGQGIFDDLHDDIAIWTDPDTGEERLFVAYADYGEVLFAEIVEENNDFVPGLGGAAPPPPAQPAIDPASASQAAQVAAAVLGGALATAMVSTLLLSRRKTTAKAPTRDR